MPKAENIEAIKRGAAKFKARDLDGQLELFASSVSHHGFSNRIRPGIAGLRDHYAQLLVGFPDARVDIEDFIAEDEKVAHRFTFYGTHRGEYMKIAPTMKMVIAAGVQIHRFERGKCVEVWQILDTLRFMSQLGAISSHRQDQK